MRKFFNLFLIVMFLFTSHAHVYGQALHFLPDAQMILHTGTTFQWPTLVGMKVDPKNPLLFDFILNPGDLTEDDSLKKHSEKLIGYFLTALTIPDSDLWVNLSPYEENRIVPYEFGLTHMGRDLLSQDYILKQMASSALYPKEKLGELFWKTVYQKVYEQYGTTDLPLDTFNKIWIIPDEAVIHELEENSLISYIQSARLKVLLESDYIALEHASIQNSSLPQNELLDDVQKITQQVTREIIIPLLEKEVNEGEHFLQLRQVYHSLILAAWYKQKLQHSLLGQSYINQKKIAGVQIDNPDEPKEIWNLYVKAFQQGVFQYIEEERDLFSDELIPRKYFAGGFDFAMSSVLQVVRDRFSLWKDKFNNRFFLVKGGAKTDQDFEMPPAIVSTKAEERFYIPASVDDQKAKIPTQETDRIESLREKIWQEQSPQSLTDVLQESLFSEKNLGNFVEMLSLMRENYQYDLQTKDPEFQVAPLGNLGYAVQTGHFLKIGEHLYVSPLTGSFRRHFLFRTDQNNRVVEAVEIMIPGDERGRGRAYAKNRKKVADAVSRAFKNDKYSVDVMLALTDVPYQAQLYKKTKPQRILSDIAVFSYPFDGARVTAVQNKEIIRKAMGISLKQLDEKITKGVVRSFLAIRQLGYFGNMDMHAENFRLGLIYNDEGKIIDIKIQLVADYGSVKKRLQSGIWGGVLLAGVGILYHLIPVISASIPKIINGLDSPSSILLNPFFIAWWGLVPFGPELTDYMSLFAFSKKYGLYPNLSLSIVAILKIFIQESIQMKKNRQFNFFGDAVLSSIGGSVSSVAGASTALTLMFLKDVFSPKWVHQLTDVMSQSSLISSDQIQDAPITQSANNTRENNVGGIDFNKEHLKINTTSDNQSQFQDMDNLYLFQLLKESEGLSPVVFNIFPFQETDFFKNVH